MQQALLPHVPYLACLCMHNGTRPSLKASMLFRDQAFSSLVDKPLGLPQLISSYFSRKEAANFIFVIANLKTFLV